MLRRDQQHALFQLGMDRYELRLRIKAGAARNAYLRSAATNYADTGHAPGHLDNRHRARVQETLREHYNATATYFGRLALSNIRKGRKAALTPIESLMLEWVRRESLRKARMIAETDRRDILDAIEEGVTEGLGVAEIATNIRRLTATTPGRAALIARTETHAAATYGSIESVRDAEQEFDIRMLKAWSPTLDARTRPDHLAMASHPAIPLDEKFTVGGEQMDRPGDPAASAAQTIACRCSLIYEEAS